MVEEYLLRHPWVPTLAWMALFSGDCYLTIMGARLRARAFPNATPSFELSPEFRDEIDNLRLFGPVFFRWLLYGVVLLCLTGTALQLHIPDHAAYIYTAVVGYAIFPFVAVYLRHLFALRYYGSPCPNGPAGELMGHPSVHKCYRRSSAELSYFALMTTLAFVLTDDPVLLGAAISFWQDSLRHWLLARRYRSSTPSPETVAESSPSEPPNQLAA